MPIGELAKRTGLSKDTLRFYEKLGLLPKAPKKENGYRDYPESWVNILRLIARARELGFTLDELKQLGLLFDKHQLSTKEVAYHLLEKEREIDAKIANLQRLKLDIQETLAGNCELREDLLKNILKPNQKVKNT